MKQLFEWNLDWIFQLILFYQQIQWRSQTHTKSSSIILLYQFKFHIESSKTFTIDDLPSNGKCESRKIDKIGDLTGSLNESPWYEWITMKLIYLFVVINENIFSSFRCELIWPWLWLDRMALLHFRKRKWKLENLLIE